jgi:hypothetical protein
MRDGLHLDEERIMMPRTIFVGLLVAASAGAQSIHGTVTERTSGSRVPGAGVVLRDAKGHPQDATLADSSGAYRVTAPSPGVYTLSIQGRGLVTLESPKIQLTASSDENFDATLELGAKSLPTITVKDRALVHAPPGNPHKYDEFLMRRKLGFGRFITRAEIDSKPQNDTRTLFTTIPGVKYWQNGTDWYLRSQRCTSVTPEQKPRPNQPIQATSPADPVIFVDGIQISRWNGLEMLRTIPPSEIEAIEVFQGLSEMPGQLKGDACFVIFIWRR